MAVLYMALIGLAVGSFLNVVIDRIPRGESIVVGRSHCDSCRKVLRWYELIPVISWVIQRGRCRRCHGAVSVQYPLVEAGTALLYVAIYWWLPRPEGLTSMWFVHAAAWCTLAAAFVGIVVTDWKYQIIPDGMLIILGVSALAARIPFPPATLGISLVAGAGVWAAFYALWLITGGKGIGLGDAKLGGVLGIILGVPAVIVGLYVAFLTGAIYGVILMIQGRAGMKSRVAFGPFLLLGGVVAYFWAYSIMRWWGFL